MAKKAETKAKNTVPEVQETPPKVDTRTLPEALGPPPESAKVPLPPDFLPPGPAPESQETRKRYVFPRQSDIKCPACGLYETVATSSPQGPIQWRRCTRAIPRCEHTFKITGTEVKVTDCKQQS